MAQQVATQPSQLDDENRALYSLQMKIRSMLERHDQLSHAPNPQNWRQYISEFTVLSKQYARFHEEVVSAAGSEEGIKHWESRVIRPIHVENEDNPVSDYLRTKLEPQMEAEEKMNVETWMESVGATAETKAAYYATLESQVNRFNVMISGGTVPHDDDAMEVEEPEEVLGIVDSFLEELKADFDKTTKTPIALAPPDMKATTAAFRAAINQGQDMKPTVVPTRPAPTQATTGLAMSPNPAAISVNSPSVVAVNSPAAVASPTVAPTTIAAPPRPQMAPQAGSAAPQLPTAASPNPFPPSVPVLPAMTPSTQASYAAPQLSSAVPAVSQLGATATPVIRTPHVPGLQNISVKPAGVGVGVSTAGMIPPVAGQKKFTPVGPGAHKVAFTLPGQNPLMMGRGGLPKAPFGQPPRPN